MWFVPLIFTVVIFFINFFILKKRFSVKRYLEDINRELSGLTDDFNRNTDRNVTIIETKINDLKLQIEKSEKIITLLKKEITSFEESVKKREKLAAEFEKKKIKTQENKPPEGNLFPEISDYEKILEKKDNVILSMQAAKVYSSVQGQKKDFVKSRDINLEKNEKEKASVTEKTPAVGEISSGVDSGIREKVKELVNQGFTAEFIADKLGVSISEVNLILFMGK